MAAGTLADYGDAWRMAQYAGLSVSASVLDWSGCHHLVRIKRTMSRHDGFVYYELSANNESALIVIDGRS